MNSGYLNIIPLAECCGCSACVNICPKKCLSMEPDEATGFSYPVVDKAKCIECGLCKKACPILSTTGEAPCGTRVLACRNSDESIRRRSSSGGVFHALSHQVLSRGGLVYGAALDAGLRVRHVAIAHAGDIAKLRGSKYVQSEIGSTYSDVKASLGQGVPVLFSGTPCQVAGLKSYLRKDYDNLYTVEVVCHGVPSPMVYERYLRHLEAKSGSKVTSVNFRDKRRGWTDYELVATFENGSEYRAVGYDNPYLRGFIANLYIRESCSNCKFKSFKSGADITLGDFWGCEKIGRRYQDNKGTSLVCVTTDKGKALFEQAAGSLTDVEEHDLKVAADGNPCLIDVVNLHPKSKYFMARYKRRDFDKLIRSILGPSKFTIVKLKLRSLINRITKCVR